jgi:hypothetical protein
MSNKSTAQPDNRTKGQMYTTGYPGTLLRGKRKNWVKLYQQSQCNNKRE